MTTRTQQQRTEAAARATIANRLRQPMTPDEENWVEAMREGRPRSNQLFGDAGPWTVEDERNARELYWEVQLGLVELDGEVDPDDFVSPEAYRDFDEHGYGDAYSPTAA